MSRSTIADYDVKEKVGQGAQGSVFRAIRKITGETVALKQIDVADLTEKERINVLAEVKVLATLAEDPYPCVMSYQESFVDSGSLWIALEWSADGTLQDALNCVQKKKRSEFEEAEIWNFFLSMALGLEHVHRMNILHRDVKMANVFLHNPSASSPTALSDDLLAVGEGSGRRLPRVQLGDFGVSTILDDRSRALTMVGTPYYLSPELCMGKPYSSKSDVWSLGVVLYVLLNQKMPYEASNYAALILRIVQEEHAKHQPASSKFSTTIRRMATWCLQKEERNRPTAREIVMHPDCLREALRLGLPVPSSLLEAACYRPAHPLGPPASSSDVARSNSGRNITTAPETTDRPLPLRMLRPAQGGVSTKRKVRVVQGVSNLPPPSPAGLPSGAASSSSRTQKKPTPTARPSTVLQAMTGSPSSCGPPKQQPVKPPTAQHVRPLPRKDVAAVRQLPQYGGSSDDEEEKMVKGGEKRSSSDALTGSSARVASAKVFTYEKRLIQQDPSRARLLLSSQGGQGSVDHQDNAGGGDQQRASSSRYLEYVRSFTDEEKRPATRSSADTIALLQRHNLAPPPGEEDAVLVGTLKGSQSSGGLQPSQAPQWQFSDARPIDGGSLHFAQHANITQYGSTMVEQPPSTSSMPLNPHSPQATHSSSIKEDTILRQQMVTDVVSEEHPGQDEYDTEAFEVPEDEMPDEDVGIGVVPSSEGGDDHEVEYEEENPDEVPGWLKDASDSEEGEEVGQQVTPGSVMWRVDSEVGSSALLPAPPPAALAKATPRGTSAPQRSSPPPSDPPTEILDNTVDVACRANELFTEGERLVGEVAFAEIVELLTRDTPLSSAALQEFVRSKVATPQQVPELMYVCFRYVMLMGEMGRMRREGA